MACADRMIELPHKTDNLASARGRVDPYVVDREIRISPFGHDYRDYIFTI